MDWENLRYFVAFVRTGTLAAAARELRVEHATVARRIAALEAALSLKLVDRRTRSYLLTTDGERIAEMGMKMEEDALALWRSASVGQQQLRGSVSLSVPPAAGTSLLTPHLGRLRERYADIQLVVRAETRLASLRSETDLALRVGRPKDPELVVRRLQRLRFSYYAAPDYLAHTPESAHVFIGYDESLEDSPQQQHMLAHAAGRALVLRSNSADIQRGAVRAGVGIALLADLPEIRTDPRLMVVPGLDNVMERDLWLVVHRDLRRAPAVRAVADFVATALSEQAPAAAD